MINLSRKNLSRTCTRVVAACFEDIGFGPLCFGFLRTGGLCFCILGAGTPWTWAGPDTESALHLKWMRTQERKRVPERTVQEREEQSAGLLRRSAVHPSPVQAVFSAPACEWECRVEQATFQGRGRRSCARPACVWLVALHTLRSKVFHSARERERERERDFTPRTKSVGCNCAHGDLEGVNFSRRQQRVLQRGPVPAEGPRH